ncbi:hypothetical protein BDW22DRAFT_1363038 [Trametopsis cervina]|nr:hypothetical protein BDW22DRAFT_1363038 [Trametopsis cervina]
MSSRFQIVPYSDLLFDPVKIAPTLRRFVDDNDKESQVLIESVLDVVQPEGMSTEWGDYWTIFLETGLHEICVEILIDDRTYAPGVDEGYPAWTFVLLRRFGVYLCAQLSSKGKDEAIRGWVKKVLDLLPPLWEYAWKNDLLKKPRLLRMPGRLRTECEFQPICLINAFDVMLNLYCLYYNQPPPITTHTAHLAVWAWAHCGDDPWIHEIVIRIAVFLVDTAEREELDQFFIEAVTQKGIEVTLAEQFCLTLLMERNVDARLRGVTSLLSAVSVHCQSVLHVKLGQSPATLLQCIRIACQRQMCSGKDERDTDGVLGASLSVFKDILVDSLDPGPKQIPAFFEMVESAKIIPMVARTTFHAIDQNDPSLFHCLEYIMELYGGSVETFRQKHMEAILRKVIIVAQRTWYPTLRKLRQHPIIGDNLQERAYMSRIRDHAVRTWVLFGKRLKLNEYVEERRLRTLAEKGLSELDVGLQLQAIAPGSRRCLWKECLCSWDAKPPHHMRVCKGCWRAWYCGPACQASDWKNHREYCLSHR